MLSLLGRLPPRNHRARLYQPESPWAKEPPTVACSQRHLVGPLEVGRQRLPVPPVAAPAEIGGAFSQHALDFRDLLRRQPARASTTRSLLQPRQALGKTRRTRARMFQVWCFIIGEQQKSGGLPSE
jgi:hypothetical protein